MDVLFLCGYFEQECEAEITRKTKTWVENAANTFQKRLITGLSEQKINLSIISAPFIGAWPKAYQDVTFHGFENEKNTSGKIEYVHFNNIWGYRNISRTKAVKKAVRNFMQASNDTQKAIIVYSPHTPLLEGAVYAKSIDPSIHICLVVPDLPQYMNLSKKAHPVYDFFKKFDIKRFMELNTQVDSYMLLTKHMAVPMQVGQRPYIVVEGIADDDCEIPQPHEKGKRVAYAGKLNESFGAKRLVEAFEQISDPDASLEICGGGELKEYIVSMCEKDPRIHYHGVVPAAEAAKLLQESDVLVNPRQNDDEYTKYSFPSKNIEYLMTGNAVVAYMLDGMPEAYREFLNIPCDNSVESLAESLLAAFRVEANNKKEGFRNYKMRNLSSKQVANRIYEMIVNGKQVEKW